MDSHPQYVCCRCLGNLSPANGCLACSRCDARFPVSDGVPYFVFFGEDWHRKLREAVLYHDFYRKLNSRAVERDRIASHQARGALIFRNLIVDFDSALARIDFSRKPRILDVGAGSGEASQFLAERGAIVDAVDYQPLDLHHAPRWFALRNVEDKPFYDLVAGEPITDIKFRRAICDSDYLPFSAGSFDVIFMRATVHHVLDMKRLFHEMNRVLKPGGQIMLLSEPFSSVFDDLKDYQIGDLDYEEGLNETRPRIRQYRSALTRSGFGDIEVQVSYASYGFRMTRALARFGRTGGGADKRIAGRVWSGRKLHLLNAFAGGMNLYANKRASVGREPHSLDPIAAQDPAPLAQALLDLPRTPETASALLRESFPWPNRHADMSLGIEDVDRLAARGLRSVEPIHGRFARYLLSIAAFHLSPTHATTKLCIEYNSAELPNDPDFDPLIMINGVRTQAPFARGGWDALRLPLALDAEEVAEVRIEQPSLIRRDWPAGEAGDRDVGLAVSRIWLE